MPHMMPMMWMLTFIFTLSSLFIVLNMLYFFIFPLNLINLKLNSNLNFKKWNWKW